MLEARTQASVAFFKLGAHSATTRIWRAMKFKVLLRKRGGARAARAAAGAERSGAANKMTSESSASSIQ